MENLLKNCPLFAQMSSDEIQKVITVSRSIIKPYKKDEFIFLQSDSPSFLHVLLEGAVVIGNDSPNGKRNIVTTFSHSGELFGEVFLFLGKGSYDNYAQSAVDSTKVLQIPKSFISEENSENVKIISNMLAILAKKAYYLNKKLMIISGGNLRQKIARTLLQNIQDNTAKLGMNREEFADFLNVARPSLSRELMKMQEERLIEVRGSKFFITNIEALKDLI